MKDFRKRTRANVHCQPRNPAVARRFVRSAKLFPAAAGVVALALAAGCDPAEGIELEPLPGAEGITAEARYGLPEIAGEWSFAGWEIPGEEPDSPPRLRPLGRLLVEGQRYDSVGGHYLGGGLRYPVVGEVRRGGVFSLVAFDEEGEGRYLAGRVERDTLWVVLTNLPAVEEWPRGTRGGFIRQRVERPFLRAVGGRDVLAPVDTMPLDTLPGPDPDAPMGPPPTALPPEQVTPRQPAQPQPAQPQPERPRPQQPAPQPVPVEPRPAPAPPPAPTPPPAEPDPEPTPPPPAPPPVLGEPVRPPPR
jgi:hypothetical protein